MFYCNGNGSGSAALGGGPVHERDRWRVRRRQGECGGRD
jgi:hypothetical protein